MARKRLGALVGRPANGRLENGVLPHRLAVVNFGAALLGAVRAQGWEMHWEGEAALRRGGEVSDGLRPDSRIRLTGPGVALTAWLEVDRGTEAWTWLAGKLERLANRTEPTRCSSAARLRAGPGRRSSGSAPEAGWPWPSRRCPSISPTR